MSTTDFAALSSAARTSVAGRTFCRLISGTHAALATSRAASLAVAWRNRFSQISAPSRCHCIGVALIAGAITHYGLSEFQAVHQRPLWAAGISLTLLVVGLALTVAPRAAAGCHPRSRVLAAWGQLFR